MKQRLPRSSLVAWWASVALHGLVLGWWGLRPPSPQAAPAPAPLELQLVEVEPLQRSPPSPAPAPARAAVVKAKPAPMTHAVSPVEHAPVEGERPTDDVPRAPSGLPSLTLSTSSSFALSLDAGVIVSDPVAPGLHALERPVNLVGDTARETIGRGKVDRGLVHPYYVKLGQALVKEWDADRVLTQGGLKAYGQQLRENLKVGNEIWLEKASQFGKTGSPLGDVVLPTQRTGPANDRVGGIAAPDFAARKELGRQMREAYKSTRRATIRVVQDASGRLIKVELVEPSNDAKVDREAMVDVRAAAEKLPQPPSEVVGARKELASLWSFELIVSISPPIPTFSFEFDEVSGFIDPRLPLDRRIYKKVRLVSVE